MKIYHVKPDSNNVQYIIPRVPEDIISEVLSFDCVKRNDELSTIKWYIFNPKKKTKEFLYRNRRGLNF